MKKEGLQKRLVFTILISLILFSILSVGGVVGQEGLAADEAGEMGGAESYNPSPGTKTNWDELREKIGSAFPTFDGGNLPAFFGKWREGQGIGALEARLVLLLVIAIAIFLALSAFGMPMFFSILGAIIFGFVFTSYITPEQLVGIFLSYKPFPATFAEASKSTISKFSVSST